MALPPTTAARGAARIGREPLFLDVPAQTWSAPRSLDAPLPEPQAQKTPRQPATPQAEPNPGAARAAYADAAGQAEALFDRLLAAAARLARETDGQLQALTDRNENQLGQALARLEEDHAQRSVDAARARDAVLERIATRTDILRAYVVEQANGALGRMSALRLELLTAIATLRKPAVEAAGALSKAITASGTAGQTARDALETLKTEKMTQFRNSGKFVETQTRGPAMIEAMLEAAVQFAAPRIAADIKALSDRWDKVRNFAEPIAACGPCEADGKLAGLQSHANNLGVAGPRAIRSARDGALASIDQTEQQLNLSVLEAHRQAEDGLAERHDQTRQMLITQSAQATLGLRRDLERSGRQQIAALAGVATTQPAALKMVEQEVDRAARATPTRAAALAVQSAARLQRNVANVAARHPGGVLGMAERNRANRLERAIAGGREQLAMVATFGQQQKQFVGETFGQVDRSMEESLYDMAGVPGRVGKSCDSMISAARQAVTEAMDKMPAQIGFIAQKLTDACDGLVPISPDSPPANPNAGHDRAPEELVCRADDGPNMSLFDPGASMSTMSSPNSSPLMSVAPPTGTSGPSGDGATASGTDAGGGTPAPAPASCAPCETARTAVRDRAAAAAAAAGESTGTSDGGAAGNAASGTTGPGNDDVGVSSARTNDRSPNAYREHATPIGTKAVSAPNVDAFLALVVANVEKKIGSQVATAKSAIDRSGETGYGDMMKNALRGLTPLQGAALSEAYLKAHGKDLASEITLHAYDGFGSSLTNTAAYNRDAALAALAGRSDEAAINELEAAFNFSNETERIFDTMESMTQDQMRAFVAAHRDRLNELMEQLSDDEKVRFQLLMDGNTVRVRSMALRSAVDGVNQRYAWGNVTDDRGFGLGDAFAAAEHPNERWNLEGPGVVDTYGLEDTTVRETRERDNWDAVQRDVGNLDGVIDAIMRTNPSHAMSHPDDPPGAILLAYATRPLEVYAVQPPIQREGESREQALERQRLEYQRYNVSLGEEQTGEYGTFRMATTSINEYQYNYLNQSIRHGSQSREARAARALAQFRRSDGRPPDYKDVEQSLHSGIADAREGGNFEHGSREEADRDRLETFKAMEQYRRQIEGGATGEISATAARAFFRDEMAAAYRDRPQDLDVALGVIDSDEGNMQAVIDQAIRREDPALLTRYLGRMDSQQIETMVTEWNRRHPEGPGLWERLGVGRGNHWSIGNWNGAVFTGDEANSLEIAMMGVPQTPKQKAEVALRILDQQIEQAGWLGRLTCSDQYDALVAQANHLRDVMGVTEADLDEQGRIRAVDRDGNVIHVNFDASGQLRPGADSTALNMLVAGSRIVADSYANAVDRMASILTTAIAVIGAVVLTVATFGAGASVLVAMAIAAGFGALTIAANASMRGGRYSRDDLTRDVVAAVVQIATAGLNVGMARGLAAGAKIAQGGATAMRAASLGGRLAATASRHALATAMLTQGAIGGMSNLASTALDPAMRRRDDYGSEVMHSFFRGFAGGAVTAGVAHGLNAGASRLVQRFAVNRAINQAVSQGTSRAIAVERAAEAAAKASSGRFMDYGVRAVVGATSATAGRTAEMGYENMVGIRQHGAGDFYRELRHAFIQNAIQGLAEGAALRFTRTRMASHVTRQAELMESERHTAAKAAGEAFDAEMARRGIVPEPPEASPAERPPGVPAAADEQERRAAETAGDERARIPRTTDEEHEPRPRTAANDDEAPGGAAGPVRTVAALAEGEMLRMGRASDGSVFIHPDSKSLQAANDNFATLVNADPTREVAIYHNPVTGEYLVVQGDPTSVAVITREGLIEGPGITGYHASALAQPQGHWELRSHFHPNKPGQTHTKINRRLPSGADGDFGVIEAEARHLASESPTGTAHRTSRIYFVDEGKLRYTDFSVHIENGNATYSLTYPRMQTGAHSGPHTFGTIGEYYTFFERLSGFPYPVAEPGTGTSLRGRAADESASLGPLDPARRVGGERASLADLLTPQNRTDAEFVAHRLGLAAGFEEARLAGRAHESGIDPLLGRIAHTGDAHAMVASMGLVDRPDSMRRLSAILNDPTLSNSVKESVLVAVRDATREVLIRRGALEPHEPLLLTLHGAPDDRAGKIRQRGIDLSLVERKATDDFAHALYFSTQLSNAQTYARRGGGTGHVFPGILRGRDMGMEVTPQATHPGSVIDVTPQGTHRAEWEAFVRANMHLLGRAEGMTSPEKGMRMMELTMEIGRQVFAENPANAGRTPTQRELFKLGTDNYFLRAPFADLDRFGTRAVLFDAFVEHLAAMTGDTRLATPHLVLGELGGVMTTGIGHGDQQALKSQRIADLLNEQLGVGRFAGAAGAEGGKLLVRTAEEPSTRAARREAEERRYWSQFERTFAEMTEGAPTIQEFKGMQAAQEPGGQPVTPPARPIPPEALEIIRNTIDAARRVDSFEGHLLNDMLTLAPKTTRRILAEIVAAAAKGDIRDLSILDVLAIQHEINAPPGKESQAMRAYDIDRLFQRGAPLHRTLSEAPFVGALDPMLELPFAAGVSERAAIGALRQFGNPRLKSDDRKEVYRLRQLDTEGLVQMITGEGSWRSRAIAFVQRRIRAGASRAEAYRDAFSAARILLRGEDFQQTHDRWRDRVGGLPHELLAELVRARPDVLLHLATSSPRQLSEWFADYILRQPRKQAVVIDHDEFAAYVLNRMISNVLPVASEASSVWGNLKRLGLQLLKADAVQRGGANRPGLDIVGFSGPENMRLTPRRKVRVVIMDDKAYQRTELESVSAMTGDRLVVNLRTSADEIVAGLAPLRALADSAENRQIHDYVAGADAAVRQMRKAARDLEAVRPASDNDLRSPAYLEKVAEILERNNIVPLISSEYGNVTALAQWLRAQGFMLDNEYAERLARQIIRRAR